MTPHSLAAPSPKLAATSNWSGHRGLGRNALPEYATPALFTGAREVPLLDRSLPKAAWKEPERAHDTGAVPMLSIGDLVGRRTELRRVYRILTDHPSSLKAIGHRNGCQITGMGGVGKSTLAGRLMARLSEEGWLTVSPQDSHWSLGGIIEALRATAPRVPNHELQRALAIDCQDDNQRLSQLKALLAEHRVLLVLDNFEDNLTLVGDAFRDPLLTRNQMLAVIAATRRGRVLVTSRYPVPETEDLLAREELGALTEAQTRKLLWRHETLRQLSRDDFQLVLRSIGGHPRMIEYLHGLLNQGRARFPNVTTLLRRNAKAAGVKLSGSRTLTEAIEDARRIGTADILLDELLATLDAGDAALLAQVAVFPHAVTPEVLGRCLVDMDRDGDLDAAAGRLAGASLLTRADGRLWVHRWTAEAIAGRASVAQRECCARGGRALKPSPTAPLEDNIDAVRLLLAAGEFDDAARVGGGVMGDLINRARQSYVASLAGEIARGLERGGHPRALAFRGIEADALLTMGEGEAGLHMLQSVLQGFEQLVRQEPGRSDLLRDLSVPYSKMGDLMSALGQGAGARFYYQKALDIGEQLVRQEPGRADLLRDLSVSYNKMGVLMGTLGQGDVARDYYQKDLDIAEQLVRQEPGRADFLHDLLVSYERMGDLMRALGRGDVARDYYQKDLDIGEQLVRQEPGRADFIRGLSFSSIKMGDLMRALGRGDAARDYYQKALDLAEQLVRQEPGRADFLRDLSVSYGKMGDLMTALGHGAEASQFLQKGLDIAEQLVAQEPGRADLVRDLSVSYIKMCELMSALGQVDSARDYCQKALNIGEQLVRQEPGRADFLRDLSVSYQRMGDLMRELGSEADAREHHRKALEITKQLVLLEPGRVDFQGDLARSYERMGNTARDSGEEAPAQQHFATSLQIREKLVALEPGRADLEVGLVVPLVGLGDRSSLSRALTIMCRLESEGRLSARHGGWRAELERMLSKLDA